uniref:Uncharacterized protein n=1 Tax=Picea glauca TaxID=3330 RepID=A0A101LVN6_PICGL|nr:hypothetical protein ABT39_MTgene2020 [Picea glauca]
MPLFICMSSLVCSMPLPGMILTLFLSVSSPLRKDGSSASGEEGKTSPLRKAISPLRRKEDLYGITQLGKSGDKTHENAIERGAFEIKPIKSSQSSL